MSINLLVGERNFRTTRDTLKASGFFAALLSNRWEDDRQPDGSFFVDADPALFEHILRYLRRGVFPVFFDPIKGHDYALYLALLEEARYFVIDPLVDWLDSKKYLQAVKVEHNVQEFTNLKDATNACSQLDKDTSVELRPWWGYRHKKLQSCPGGIPSHAADLRRCEGDPYCKPLLQKGEGLSYHETWFFRCLTLTRKIVIDEDICVSRD